MANEKKTATMPAKAKACRVLGAAGRHPMLADRLEEQHVDALAKLCDDAGKFPPDVAAKVAEIVDAPQEEAKPDPTPTPKPQPESEK